MTRRDVGLIRVCHVCVCHFVMCALVYYHEQVKGKEKCVGEGDIGSI